MKVYPKKERGGWVVYAGADALVRGLREKRDAHRICHDVMKKGFFKGTVMFATGRALDIVVPADADPPLRPRVGQPDFTLLPDNGEGTVEDL